jgi:hypothetical protein
MRLPDLQRAFIETVQFESANARLLDEVLHDGYERLKIYRNNVENGIYEALKSHYPTIYDLVGEGFFRSLSQDFSKAHPPEGGNMDEYGSRLPVFLASYAPVAKLEYLPDMARFDWALHGSLNAPDDNALDASLLAVMHEDDVEGATLPLRSCVKLIASNHPLVDIWRFCKMKQPDATLNLDIMPRHFVMYRTDTMDVWFEEIAPADYAALKNMAAHRPLFKAFTAACGIDEDFDMAAFLTKYMARELFSEAATLG